jgi:anti-anti-sigma factor
LDPDLGDSFTGTTRLRVACMDGTRPTHLALVGELDGTEHPTLHRAIASVVHRHPGETVALDASGVTFLDSGGLRALLLCRDHVVDAGSELVVVTAGPVPYRVLEITGLLDMFGTPRLVESQLTLG